MLLKKSLQDAVKHTHGSTMKHLTKNILIILWFPIQFERATKIASELDLLSKLILGDKNNLKACLLVKSRYFEEVVA